MKRLLLSALILLIVASTLALTTSAFFSGTISSNENKLEAASFDLTLSDDEGQVYNSTTEVNKVFFDFTDYVPGDFGLERLALNVAEHEYWACVNVSLTESAENSVIGPEVLTGDTSANEAWDGEMDDLTNFILWADDGDKKFEASESVIREGTFGNLPQGDDNLGETYTIADSTKNVFNTGNASVPLTPGVQHNIEGAWCLGDITLDANEEAGFSCIVNPDTAYNNSQTDSLKGDIHFYIAQAKHNTEFKCEDWSPVPDEE